MMNWAMYSRTGFSEQPPSSRGVLDSATILATRLGLMGLTWLNVFAATCGFGLWGIRFVYTVSVFTSSYVLVYIFRQLSGVLLYTAAMLAAFVNGFSIAGFFQWPPIPLGIGCVMVLSGAMRLVYASDSCTEYELKKLKERRDKKKLIGLDEYRQWQERLVQSYVAICFSRINLHPTHKPQLRMLEISATISAKTSPALVLAGPVLAVVSIINGQREAWPAALATFLLVWLTTLVWNRRSSSTDARLHRWSLWKHNNWITGDQYTELKQFEVSWQRKMTNEPFSERVEIPVPLSSNSLGESIFLLVPELLPDTANGITGERIRFDDQSRRVAGVLRFCKDIRKAELGCDVYFQPPDDTECEGQHVWIGRLNSSQFGKLKKVRQSLKSRWTGQAFEILATRQSGQREDIASRDTNPLDDA